MKRILAICLIALPSIALAAGKAKGPNYPMAGCGLAYVLFSKDNNTQGVQILAGTTNNLYGTQSFGITSGTSGCAEGGLFTASRESEVYAEVNFRQLQSEIAAGKGEYLNALAGLLGVNAERRTEFFQLARVRYSSLFPSPDAGSTELLEGLTKALQDHPELMG
ncbi:MAG: DUF3015 family protein [Elusimicrobia bacterium]|nr:DUF3015 family protein [Elusimicrobiota bacterium]